MAKTVSYNERFDGMRGILMTDRQVSAVLLLCLFSHPALAQATQQCEPSTASSILDANNVRAKIMNNGGLFWNGGANVYEVPKGGGVNSVFAAGIWIGGLVNGDLRLASTTYGPWEFWSGPHDEVSLGADCAAFDRIYEVHRRDLNALVAGIEPSVSVLDWPWQYGAPVVDGDGVDGNYNLAGGDRPLLLGDEMHYWIMNDIGNVHQNSDTPPLGIEVHGMAFSTSSRQNPHFENTTFYQYTIINKGPDVIEDAYLGFFTDVDLGAAFDDYVGSDPPVNLAFTYNADNLDEGSYRQKPPAIGFQIVSGDGSNPDQVSEMASFVYYNHGGGPTGHPQSAEGFYNYMSGRWKDGQPITFGGNGRDFSSIPVTHMFSGRAEKMEFWSENNVDNQGSANPPGDRRSVSAAGPFSLSQGEKRTVLIAVISGFGTDHLNSISVVKDAAASYMDLSAGGIPRAPTSGVAPTRAPSITNVGNGATNQPLDLELRWDWSGAPIEFELRLENSEGDKQAYVLQSTTQQLTLQENTAYSVRVRAATDEAYGPWSDVVTFSTGATIFSSYNMPLEFLVTANAAGPLNPPENGAFAFSDNGFPLSAGSDRPDRARQQTNGSAWGVATGRSSSAGHSADYATFVSRSLRNGWGDILPYDFEARFTEECYAAWRAAYDSGEAFATNPTIDGCYAYDRFSVKDGYSLQHIPFEVWRTGIDTPDNSSDDVRMVVAAFDSNVDGWGIDHDDHPVSGGADDPQTDRTYWYLPLDLTPGDSGHNEWLQALLDSCYPFTPACNAAEHGGEPFSRIVFVNWNGGEVAGQVYDADMPEAGTIFRIESAAPPAPIPGAPTASSFISPGYVSFSWSAFINVATRLEVATDEAFTNVIYSADTLASPHISRHQFELGTYHWRVFDLAGSASVPVEFRVGNVTGVSSDASTELPNEVALLGSYPNPFSSAVEIGYQIPEAGHARLRVYDVLGRLMATLIDEHHTPGNFKVAYRGDHLPSGVYYYDLETDHGRIVRTMVRMR